MLQINPMNLFGGFEIFGLLLIVLAIFALWSTVKVVPQGRPSATLLEPASATGGWLPPGGYAQCSQWALDNREALTAYAQQIEEEGTASEQLEKYLAQQSPGPSSN